MPVDFISTATPASALATGNPLSRPSSPFARPLQVGFYGLGGLGYLIARNLAQSTPTDAPGLVIYNRTASKSEKLAAEVGGKARVANSVAQLVRECDVVITNLANDKVVTGVYDEFVRVLTVRVLLLRIFDLTRCVMLKLLAGDACYIAQDLRRNQHRKHITFLSKLHSSIMVHTHRTTPPLPRP